MFKAKQVLDREAVRDSVGLRGWSVPLFSPSEQRGSGAQPRTRILVVEDDYFVATHIESVLDGAGFDLVGVTHTGEDAVKLALAAKPDLVLMDVRLAGRLDGAAAAREIVERAGIRCLFVTAHADEVTRARAAPARPLGWLEKPFTAIDLLRAVRSALAAREDDR